MMDNEFTQEEILLKRRELAKMWDQSLNQVMDIEAIHYLKDDRKK